MKGKIKSKEVVVLIDSGASHNFVSKKLVDEIGLTPTATNEFKVQMDNGDEIGNSGVCKGIRLKLEVLKVMLDFFSFVM